MIVDVGKEKTKRLLSICKFSAFFNFDKILLHSQTLGWKKLCIEFVLERKGERLECGIPKNKFLAILFLLMFQNKSHGNKNKYDASEKISVNCVLEKYILQKWHTRRQRRGVLFFQPQCCLYVILKLKDSKVIKFVLLTLISNGTIQHHIAKSQTNGFIEKSY